MRVPWVGFVLALTLVLGCEDDGSDGSDTAAETGGASVSPTSDATAMPGDDGMNTTTGGAGDVTGDDAAESGDDAMSTGADATAASADTGGGATFSCGEMACTIATEYCLEVQGGPAEGGGPSYECYPFPGNCAPEPACECLNPMGCQCSQAPDGGITMTCFAP